MFNFLEEKQSIIREAEKARFLPNIFLKIFIFSVVFLVSQFATAIPIIILVLINMFMVKSSWDAGTSYPDTVLGSIPNENLIMLFSTVMATIVTIIFCRFIERRSLHSMGFVKYNAMKDYFMGLLIGFIMFAAAVFIAWVTGTLEYNGITIGNTLPLIILFFIGFLFQGMSEEVMLRGYLLVTLSAKGKIIVAVLINSGLFAIMHLANDGITLLSVVNLTLFGVFASLFMLKSDSIWGVCSIHSIWNFVQGNVFGINVSGMKLEASIFSFEATTNGTLINGGSFGLEGGLAVTIVLVAGIIGTYFMKAKDNSITSNTN